MSERKTAIITGGGTGIGLACARLFAAQGWRAVSLGLDREENLPDGVVFRALDVTSEADINAALAEVDQISVLVNAAGLIRHEGREWTSAGFKQVIDVNLIGTQLVTVACKDALARARGAVINVASMFSYFGSARNPAYAASKGAIVALTRSQAIAFAELGIRVNAVAPGWIDTKLASGALHNPERAPAILARIPMQRFGQPDDVAQVVGFLASPAARYITGVVIPIDGGFHIS